MNSGADHSYERNHYLHRRQPWVPGRSGDLACLLLIWSVAVVAYLPALGNGFVWDDILLLSSELIQNQVPARSAFTQDYWHLGRVWSDTGGYYRPLSALSLRLDYYLGLGTPKVFHATNLFLHGVASAALWPMMRRYGAPPTIALISALLFAIHPHHAETVSWVSGRPDLLMSACIFVALSLRSGWSIPFGICALLSKEAAVVWPVVAAIRDRRILSWQRCTQVALVVAYLVVRALVLGSQSARLFDLDIGTGARAFLFELGTWLYPPATPWAFTPILSWTGAPVMVWVGLLLFVILLSLFLTSNISRRLLVAAALIHIPAAIVMSSRSVLGMRPLYAASAFLVGAVTPHIVPFSKKFPTLRVVLAVPLGIALVYQSDIISRRWRDDLSFQQHAASESPHSLRVQMNLAVSQRNNGRLADAWATTHTALQLGHHEGIHFVRGQLMDAAGCSANAASEYGISVRINPQFSPAHEALRKILETSRQSINEYSAPQAPEAQVRLRRCARVDPEALFSNSSALLQNATDLQQRGRLDTALIAATGALTLDPLNAAAHLAAAHLNLLTKNYPSAIAEANTALELNSETSFALKVKGLALMLSNLDPPLGAALIKKYLALNPEAEDRERLEALLSSRRE